MQVFRDGNGDAHFAGIACEPLVATTTSPEAAPSGTRATMNCSELMTTEPSKSPKLHLRAAQLARAQPVPNNADLAAGQGATGIDGLDVRIAVHVLCARLAFLIGRF